MRLSCAALFLFTFTGCERAIVEGRTTNQQGEALPGVVARLAGSDRQDLTDALGRYRLTAARDSGEARIQLSKSGYAPAEVNVGLSGGLVVRAADATLWPLPLNPGVFTLDGTQYMAADWVLPKQYYLKEGSNAFGAELPETLRARAGSDELFIVCYRTPRYNARLSRLAPAEATVPGLGAEPLQIWIESGTIGAGLEPVDHPAGQLLRVVVDRPLEPGVYGLHWGAMEGYTTLDNRLYAFEIVAPPEPGADAEAASDAESGDEDAEQDGESDEAEPAREEEPAPDLLEPPIEDLPQADDPARG